MKVPNIAHLLVSVSLLLMTACVHKYDVPEDQPSLDLIARSTRVFVRQCKDGADDRPKTYKGSGSWTQSAIAEALRDRGARVIEGDAGGNLADALANARAANAEILVSSKIAHWSDRVTEWSGIPDRITINITVVDVSSGKSINRQSVKASSRWATLGGDHPQDLLPELTRRWANTVMK